MERGRADAAASLALDSRPQGGGCSACWQQLASTAVLSDEVVVVRKGGGLVGCITQEAQADNFFTIPPVAPLSDKLPQLATRRVASLLTSLHQSSAPLIGIGAWPFPPTVAPAVLRLQLRPPHPPPPIQQYVLASHVETVQ